MVEYSLLVIATILVLQWLRIEPPDFWFRFKKWLKRKL